MARILLVGSLLVTILASTYAYECSQPSEKLESPKTIAPCTCVQSPVYPTEGDDACMFTADYWNGEGGGCGDPEPASLTAPCATPAGSCEAGDCDDGSCEGARAKENNTKAGEKRGVPDDMKNWDNAFSNFFIAERGMEILKARNGRERHYHVEFDLPSRSGVHARIAKIKYDADRAQWPVEHGGRPIPAAVRASWLLAGSREFWIGVEIDPRLGTPPAAVPAEYVADIASPPGIVYIHIIGELIPVHIDE